MAARHLVPGIALLLVLYFGGMQAGRAEPINECSRPLVIRASETYSPFSMKDANGMAAGIDNQFIARVMRATGCKFKFEFMPWKRALYAIEHGDIDVLPSASFTEERAKYGLFSVPYRNDVIGFVVRKGDARRIRLNSLDDVARQHLVIGHVRGAYRGEAFKAFSENPDNAPYISDVSMAPLGVQLLMARRIDLLLGIPTAYVAQADELGFEGGVEEHPLILAKEPVRLMFSAKTISPLLAQKLSNAIERETLTDTYHSIYGNQSVSTN
ncbi:ABC transporter substrate-binding protein [Thalassospira profundimaris]|nr:transporter substrate-binding domain-containing protein [Thalassospira profundimaris]